MNYEKKIPEFLIISFFLILTISSCNKYDIFETKLDSEISAIKEKFIKDQKNSMNKNPNFRQSLKRIIEWEKYQKSGNLILVPVKLRYNSNMRNKDGSNNFDKQVWLRFSNDEHDYTMYTLIPDKSTKSKKFTGILFMEDYFQGDVTYTFVKNGETDFPLISEKLSKKGIKKSTNELRAIREVQICDDIPIGWTCVDPITDLEGDDAEPACGYRFEKVCNMVSVPDIPDFPSGGGGGGSPGDNNGGGTIIDTVDVVVPTFIKISSLDIEAKRLFRIGLKNMTDFCLYLKLLNSFPNGTSVKIKGVPIDPNFPSVIYNMKDSGIYCLPEILEIGDQLAHEIFHAFQTQVSIGRQHNFSRERLSDGRVIYNDGYINIEFERMIFMDLAKRIKFPKSDESVFGEQYGNKNTDTLRVYRNFMNEVYKQRNNPNYFDSLEFEENYFKEMYRWKRNTEYNYHKSNVVDTLMPRAFRKIIKSGIDCKN